MGKTIRKLGVDGYAVTDFLLDEDFSEIGSCMEGGFSSLTGDNGRERVFAEIS